MANKAEVIRLTRDKLNKQLPAVLRPNRVVKFETHNELFCSKLPVNSTNPTLETLLKFCFNTECTKVMMPFALFGELTHFGDEKGEYYGTGSFPYFVKAGIMFLSVSSEKYNQLYDMPEATPEQIKQDRETKEN